MTSAQSAPAPAPAGPSGRTAALVVVAAVLVAMLALPVRYWFLQQARLAEVESQLTAVEAEITGLTEQQQHWAERSVVEREARLRLNYVYPGEVGIVVLDPTDSHSTSTAEQPQTWFEGLWQTVDSASGRGETTLGDQLQVRPTAPR